MMNLLYHLVVFGITGCHALEEIFMKTSHNQNLPQHDLEAVTNVDNGQCFQSTSNLDTTNKRKRISDSPNHLLSHSDLLQDSHIDPITSNNALYHWDTISLDSHSPKRFHPMTTATNELPSSNHDVIRSDPFASKVIQQPSGAVLNITPNSNFDPHQNQISSQTGPQPLYDGNPQLSRESLESIGRWASSSNFISQADASFIPNVPPLLPQKEIISNRPKTSSSMFGQETSVSDNQVLPPERNSANTSTDLALSSSYTIPCQESQFDHRWMTFLFSKKLRDVQYSFESIIDKQGQIDEESDDMFDRKLDFCRWKKDILFDYMIRNYNLDIQYFFKSIAYRRSMRVFPAYLLYVEVINSAVPVDHIVEAMKTACHLFLIVDQCFALGKTEALEPEFWEYMQPKVKRPSRSSLKSLIWCFLEVSLKYGRPLLFKQVKVSTRSGQVATTFKAHFNHLFSLHLEEFTETVIKPSLPNLGQIHQGSNGKLLPSLSEGSRLKFDENAFVLDYPNDRYLQTLANALKKLVNFPNVISVQEFDIGRLTANFVKIKKALIKQENANKPKSTLEINNVQPVKVRPGSLLYITGHYLKNAQTWLNYFDETYNLQLQKYAKLLRRGRSKQIFPLYLYYAEMINQIVDRHDPSSGGMVSAFKSYVEQVKNNKSLKLERDLEKSSALKDGEISIEIRRVVMGAVWEILNYWLKTQWESLFSEGVANTGKERLSTQFKGFFNDIFMLSCEILTDKLTRLRLEKTILK